MASQIGTAAGLEDFLTKLVTFISTDSELVAASQNWEVMREWRDNIASYSTDLVEPSEDGECLQSRLTSRRTPEQLNSDNSQGTYCDLALEVPQKFIAWQLKLPKPVHKIEVRGSESSELGPHLFGSITLQTSSDGESWSTNQLFEVNQTEFGQKLTFALSNPTASGLHYRVLLSDFTSAKVAWKSICLLDSEGEVVNQYGSEFILKGPGSSETDQIFVGLRSEYSLLSNWFNILLNGYTGFDTSEDSWFSQPGALPGGTVGQSTLNPMIPLWNDTIPYWFSASGRSVRFCAKVGDSYEGGYFGLVLPYATPAQFPYPLAIGGSLVPTPSSRGLDWKHDLVSAKHGTYVGPGSDGTGSGTLCLRSPQGFWESYQNRGANPSDVHGLVVENEKLVGPSGSVWPHSMSGSRSEGVLPLKELFGGGYILQPCVLYRSVPEGVVYGQLEGVYVVSGNNNAAENTVTQNGKQSVVFQQCFRTDSHEYWAQEMA